MEDTIQAFNESWLLPPAEGEVYEPSKAYLARLQGFALPRGFAVMTTASRAGRFRFGCIHHGNESKNRRKLVVGEFRRGTPIALAIRTHERLQGPQN
jgi:hypothetical protein